MFAISIFTVVISLTWPLHLYAQQKPWSINYKNAEKIVYKQCSAIENLVQEIEDESKPRPFRFAELKTVDFSTEKDGIWDTLADGRIMWRCGIESEGAYSLNFNFSEFDIPEGAKVYVYSPDYEEILGEFTKSDFERAGTVGIAPIAGSRVIVEYNQPSGIHYTPVLVVNRVGHDFTNMFGKKALKSGSCNVNINCPDGEDWQIEKNAVAHLVIMDQYVCSGALINNTSYDGTPYLLTANHCVNTYNAALNTEFVFRYEYSDCAGTLPEEKKFIYGSELIATGKNDRIDFSLLKLSEKPTEDFMPYYAGWNRTDIPATNVVSIHHPSGDYKKISIDDDPVETADYGYGFLTNSHWQIFDWEVGTTEGGSSGSPLFDQNHLIVGDLTGGEAYCGNSVNDYYSKLSVAWDNDPDPFYQLKAWLDPLGNGTEMLNGFNPYAANAKNDLAVYQVFSPGAEVCQQDFIVPEVVVRNLGMDTISSFQLFMRINGNNAAYKLWTGTLLPNAKVNVPFDSLELDFGKYSLTFYSELPNNKPDANLKNDTIHFKFEYRDSQKVYLELKTDEWSEETIWLLTNDEGKTIAENPKLANNQLYKQQFCLDEGCYLFKIFDQMEDGFCESGEAFGYYSLTNTLINQVYVQDSCFGAEQITQFCIIPIWKQNHNNKLIYTLFPNPVSDILQLHIEIPEQVSIQITDLSGKIVSTKLSVSGINQIDVSHLKAGMYLIRFRGKDINHTDKFIIQH